MGKGWLVQKEEERKKERSQSIIIPWSVVGKQVWEIGVFDDDGGGCFLWLRCWLLQYVDFLLILLLCFGLDSTFLPMHGYIQYNLPTFTSEGIHSESETTVLRLVSNYISITFNT